jgi:antitoxin ParD1/3/4
MKSKTTTMNVSLPGPLRERLDEKVERLGSYGSKSEYVRELIRRDLEHDARAQVDSMLLDGIVSGDPVPVDAKWWKDQRAAIATHRRKKKA